MLKEGSVIAVAGARRFSLLLAGIFWLVISGISFVVVAYKAMGIGLASTMMAFGPFQPAESTGAFYIIAALMIVGFSWLMRAAWRQFKEINTALLIPLDDEIGKSAAVVASIEGSVKRSSSNLMASVRKAIDENKAQPPGSEP